MKKITSISEEQEEQIPIYRERFRQIGLSTETCDKKKAKEAIFDCYEFLGLKKPKHFFWLDSPLGAAFAHAFLSQDFKGKLIKDQLGYQLEAQLGAQLGDQLGDQLRGQLGYQLWDQLGDQLGAQLRGQLEAQLGYQLGDQLRGQLWAQLGYQLWDQLGDQLGDQLRGQLGDQLRGQLGYQLEAQLGAQLRVQLGAQLRGQLWAQLGYQLWDQLRGQLEAQLGYQLEAQLRGQLWGQINNFNVWSFSFGSFESYWISFYAYLNDILPVQKCAGADIARRIAENCGCYLTYENAVIASDRPKELHFDEEKRLHNMNGAAILYRDGYEVCAINGVRMTGNEWVCHMKADELDPAKVMTIENIEQRLMAIKKIGIERVLSKLNAKVISKGALDSSGLTYKLHEVELAGSREKLFEMQNPSEDKKHYEWVVPECETIQEADMWRRGFDDFKMKYQPTNLRA